jgi:hypothetical protein
MCLAFVEGLAGVILGLAASIAAINVGIGVFGRAGL